MGKISITSKQAAYFEVKPYSQWSPYLEKCCLLLSANSSYEHASQDIEVLTGMSVSRGTQQRLVQGDDFELPTVSEAIEEISHPEEKKPSPELEWPKVSKAMAEISHPEEKKPSPEPEWPTNSEVVEEISIDGGKCAYGLPKVNPVSGAIIRLSICMTRG